MPIFEYRCTKCGHEFEELVFGSATPACPVCHAAETEKLLSRPCRFCPDATSVNPDAYARAAASGYTPGGGHSGCAGCAGGHCSSCH